MTIEKAVSELNEYGFHIKQVEANKFIVYDTGLFGFIEDEDPFIVDEDEILEIHETYLKKMLKFTPPHSDTFDTLYISRKKYVSGNTCIDLIDALDHCPYMCATINIDGLSKTEVAIKNYSENEGILPVLIASGIIKEPHRYVNSGFVELPICELC